jgi:hypothetical protein
MNNGSTGAENATFGKLRGTSSAADFAFTYAQSKKIRIKFTATWNAISSNNFGIGLAVTAASIYAAETDTTTGTVRILNKAGVLWFCSANGTSTNTNIDSGITDNALNEFQIDINP